MSHRDAFYSLLSGEGIEIGALHERAPLPANCRVHYVDAMTRAEAIEYFPEIDHSLLVEPEFICNLDRDDLPFATNSTDFIVFSHVIEHVANPARVIGEIFRILRPGGRVLLAAPDKRFTFDRTREITTTESLLTDYRQQVSVVPEARYLDFLRHTGAHVFEEPPENLPDHLRRSRARRDHCSVWDTETFREFLEAALDVTGSRAKPVLELGGDETKLEYCAVWEKLQPSFWQRIWR